MEIITQELLASNFIKNILSELWQEFTNDKKAHENCVTFDNYVWEYRQRLGEIVCEQIGEMYGDLDDAINEVME